MRLVVRDLRSLYSLSTSSQPRAGTESLLQCSINYNGTAGGVPRPLREGVQIKQRHRVAVDGDTESDDAQDVHDETRLHHVDSGHGAVTEHDGIGGRGDWKSEGVGANNSSRESEIDGIDAHGDGHLGEDRDEHVGRGGVGRDVGDGDGQETHNKTEHNQG